MSGINMGSPAWARRVHRVLLLKVEVQIKYRVVYGPVAAVGDPEASMTVVRRICYYRNSASEVPSANPGERDMEQEANEQTHNATSYRPPDGRVKPGAKAVHRFVASKLPLCADADLNQ